MIVQFTPAKRAKQQREAQRETSDAKRRARKIMRLSAERPEAAILLEQLIDDALEDYED